MSKKVILLITLCLGFAVISCEKKAIATTNNHTADKSAQLAQNAEQQQATSDTQSKTKVTFIELGSVNCIPCKQMQPVMKAIEEKYHEQVKIIFYDVWTKEGKPYAQQYKIRVIPTQVFLDSAGNEFFRHEGFYPLEEIEKILQQKGVQ